MKLEQLRNAGGKIWLNIASSTYPLEHFANLDNHIAMRVLDLPVLLPLVPRRWRGLIDQYRQARRKAPMFRHDCRRRLPVPDHSVDHVLCSHFLEHVFPDEAGLILKDFHRVLKPGGRYGFTTWYGPDKSPLFHIILQAINEYGTMDVGLPPSPPPFKFAEPEACSQALKSMGFVGIEHREIPIEFRVATGSFMDFLRRFAVRIVMVLERQDEEAKLAIEAAIEQNLQRFDHDGINAVPMPAVMVSAQKPT